MTPERLSKFKKVIHQRQPNLTVILENVHDPHNVSAVMRTCDSVGIMEIYALYTENCPEILKLGKRSSSSARKWIDVHLFDDSEACFAAVKAKYNKIYSTHLAEDSKSLYKLDLCESVALLFGNEREGLSKKALSFSNGNFNIPQVGMIESLNISVACAVTLYEAFRQRNEAGIYEKGHFSLKQEALLLEEYKERGKQYNHTIRVKDSEK